MYAMRSGGTENRLLAVLPSTDQLRILAASDTVELVSGDLLCEAGGQLSHVYFPVSATISLVTPLDSCAGIEVALVGCEGMVGVPLLLGVSVSPVLHIVQSAGRAVRISAPIFRRELTRSPPFRRRLLRFAFVKMHQLAQTAACVRYHLVEARLARWLLMAHDRSPSDTFNATHEYIAYMLGVRRVGITKAATILQGRSLIHYSRGSITVLDRAGLQVSACGCYHAANTLYQSILD